VDVVVACRYLLSLVAFVGRFQFGFCKKTAQTLGLKVLESVLIIGIESKLFVQV